jgi:hypothetical protein
MTYSFYKVLHLIGVFMIVMPLSAIAMHTALGGDRTHLWRRPAAIVHGLGMLVCIVAGFGALAKLQLGETFPLWVTLKLGIWLILGGMIGLMYRFRSRGFLLWGVLLALASVASYLAIVKP